MDNEFKISAPEEGDEVAIGPVHVQAWLETYLDEEHGITADVLHAEVDHVATADGNAYRKNVFDEAQANPDKVFYRVVKNSSGQVVGFMHCNKEETQNVLGGLYLLNEAKGAGVGSKLMNEFLRWADKTKPCFLKVFTTNTNAINFYRKYGFEISYEPPELKGKKFAFVEMIRPAELRNIFM